MSTSKIRTVVLALDTQKPLESYLYRQCPGEWPLGSSLAGRTLFLPPVGQSFEADWLVCPTPPPEQMRTSIPKQRRIFLVMEPPEYWQPSAALLDQFGWVLSPYRLEGFSGAQISSVTSGLFWWYGICMDGHRPTGKWMNLEQLRAEDVPQKMWKVSTITSVKNFLPGHKARLEFTALLKGVLGDRLDLFGFGHNPIQDKRDALLPYQFHVAIENAVHPHYWTEKLADPLLGRCVVFYHGATEIERVFSKGSVVPIDIAQPQKALETVLSHFARPDIDFEAIEKTRLKVLESFNFPFFIDRLISAIEEETGS